MPPTETLQKCGECELAAFLPLVVGVKACPYHLASTHWIEIGSDASIRAMQAMTPQALSEHRTNTVNAAERVGPASDDYHNLIHNLYWIEEVLRDDRNTNTDLRTPEEHKAHHEAYLSTLASEGKEDHNVPD